MHALASLRTVRPCVRHIDGWERVVLTIHYNDVILWFTQGFHMKCGCQSNGQRNDRTAAARSPQRGCHHSVSDVIAAVRCKGDLNDGKLLSCDGLHGTGEIIVIFARLVFAA